MSQKQDKAQEKPHIWIQFQVTQQEYADIQRLKAMGPDPMQMNRDFYRDLLNEGIKAKEALLCP